MFWVCNLHPERAIYGNVDIMLYTVILAYIHISEQKLDMKKRKQPKNPL